MSSVGLTGWQQFLLVFFRFSIGWHLFYQGMGKFQSVHWTSLSYLKSATGPLAWTFSKLADSPRLLSFSDQTTIWGLMILGTLLMLGLFTRTASAGAILLLGLFYAASPPFPFHGFAVSRPDGNELYVNKIFIEVTALVLNIAFDTGKTSGLDLLVSDWLHRKASQIRPQTTAATIQDR